MSLVFARQVAVIDAISGRVLEYVSRNHAMAQFAAGSVKIDFIRPGEGVVCVARLSAPSKRVRVRLDAKPGSFGIDREEHAGHTVFAHKETWGHLLRAAA